MLLRVSMAMISYTRTHAAKMSARSRYCQYSKFGIGSSREAGRDRRLSDVSLDMDKEGLSDKLATSLTPTSLY